MAKGDDRRQVIEEFEEAVNMAPRIWRNGSRPTSPSRSARVTARASPRATSLAAGSSRSSERRSPTTPTTTSLT
jgi:hypothetical protein